MANTEISQDYKSYTMAHDRFSSTAPSSQKHHTFYNGKNDAGGNLTNFVGEEQNWAVSTMLETRNQDFHIIPGNFSTSKYYQLDFANENVPFPWKLHEMLDFATKEKLEDVVSWLPDDGNNTSAFRVHAKELFVEKVLPRFFQQTKYKSFQRQLNIWGFQRLREGLGEGGYKHPFFVRDKPYMSRFMKRQTRKKMKKGAAGAAVEESPTAQQEQAKQNNCHQIVSPLPRLSIQEEKSNDAASTATKGGSPYLNDFLSMARRPVQETLSAIEGLGRLPITGAAADTNIPNDNINFSFLVNDVLRTPAEANFPVPAFAYEHIEGHAINDNTTGIMLTKNEEAALRRVASLLTKGSTNSTTSIVEFPWPQAIIEGRCTAPSAAVAEPMVLNFDSQSTTKAVPRDTLKPLPTFFTGARRSSCEDIFLESANKRRNTDLRQRQRATADWSTLGSLYDPKDHVTKSAFGGCYAVEVVPEDHHAGWMQFEGRAFYEVSNEEQEPTADDEQGVFAGFYTQAQDFNYSHKNHAKDDEQGRYITKMIPFHLAPFPGGTSAVRQNSDGQPCQILN